MNERQAISAFACLAQKTRLRIVQLIVNAGPNGLAAGEIAERVKASPSNVSFHLKELEQAELLDARREARSIIYSANHETLSGLLEFLMKDCCGGHPEICKPSLAQICCAPAPKSKKTYA